MKTLLIAAVACLLTAPALAGTYTIPEDKPAATVDVPDKGWTATKIARGIEVSDEDDEVYLAIEGVDGNNAEAITAGAVIYLARGGVNIDASTKTEKEGKMNGFPVYDIGWKGKDKDGEVLVHLTIVSITPQQGILFTYWASPKGDKENDDAITAMIKSIKKIN